MYTSPDEARSDLLLSAGIYLFGPLVLDTVLEYIPLLEVPVLGPVVLILAVFATTALVPLLLLRYRRESLASYGVSPRRSGDLLLGVGLAVPLLAVGLLGGALGLAPPPRPTALVVGLAPSELVVAVVEQVVEWTGLAFLAAYATVKARDAFRSERMSLDEGVRWIGRPLGIAGAVLTLLLLLTGDLGAIGVLALAVAAGLTVLLSVRAAGRTTTTKAVLLTPTVLLGLREFTFGSSSREFLVILWFTAVTAALGFAIGATQESRDGVLAALGIGLVVGLAVRL